jgi:hypothetical protein
MTELTIKILTWAAIIGVACFVVGVNDIGLRVNDGLQALVKWPRRLQQAYRHTPRHSRNRPLPGFMKTWHLR